MTEHKEWIERTLHDLAAEPVQAGDEFKQRLITTLLQEQDNILQARADRSQRSVRPFFHWVRSRWSQPIVRWAFVVAVLVSALVGTRFHQTTQHLWTQRSRPLLTIHQGVVQISPQQPSAPEEPPQSQGDVISVVEGARIVLNEGSTASLLLFNGSKVELLAGTQLTLTKVQPRSIWQAQTVQMQMTTGQVQIQVSPLRSPDERFEVDLPAALISVRGTVFRAQVISPQHTYVATDEGVVEVMLHDPAQGNPLVRVPAGYQVDAIIGQPLQVHPQATSDSVTGEAVAILPSPGATQIQNEITPSPVLAASDPVTATPTSRPSTTATTPSEITTTVTTTETAISGNIVTDTPPVTLTDTLTPSHISTPTAPLAADLELVQVDTPNPAAAEGILTYMLTVTNHGPGDAQDIVVRDVLPPQVRLVDSTLPVMEQENDQTPTAAVGWKLGTLTAGDEHVLQIVVAVHSWVTQSFTNTAIVTATSVDDNPHNNQSTVETAITDVADLAISAEIPTIIGSGSVVTCTLVYTNFGPAAARSVTVVEQLPAEMSFGGVVNADLRPLSRITGVGTLAFEEFVPGAWMTPKLAAGESGHIVFTATVQPGVLGSLASTVVITSASPDSDWNNNGHDQVTLATPVADVTIVQSAAPNPVVAGSALTYTLTYTNRGPWTAENVFITAILPASVTLPTGVALTGQASRDLMALTQTGQSLTWFTPSLLPGASGVVVLAAMVDRHAAGPLHSHAAIRSATLDGNPDDNTAAGSVNALMPALSLAHTVQPDVIAPRQPCTYTLYVTNTGAVTFAAQSLVLVETLPPGFYPITLSAAPLAATTTQPMTLTRTWAWHNSAPLSPGESFSVSLVVSATETVSPGLYLSTAGVTVTVPARLAQGRPVRQVQSRPGGPLTAMATIPVRLALPSAAVVQQATGDGTSIATSDRVTLTIRLINTGPSPLTAVPLIERYDPRILHLVGADPDPGDVPGDGTVGWHNLIQAPPHGIGHSMLPGKGLTVTLAFDITRTLAVSSPVESRVTIGELRDVYGNLSDGYTIEEDVYRMLRLYLPLMIRSP